MITLISTLTYPDLDCNPNPITLTLRTLTLTLILTLTLNLSLQPCTIYPNLAVHVALCSTIKPLLTLIMTPTAAVVPSCLPAAPQQLPCSSLPSLNGCEDLPPSHPVRVRVRNFLLPNLSPSPTASSKLFALYSASSTTKRYLTLTQTLARTLAFILTLTLTHPHLESSP